MKHKIYPLIALCAAVTACSNDSEFNSEPKSATTPIDFNVYINNITRGSDVTTSNLSSFRVYGYEYTPQSTIADVFTGSRFVTKQTTGSWVYSPVEYWVTGAKYWFVGMAPNASTTNAGATYGTFTPATTWPSGTQSALGTIAFNNGATESAGAEPANGNVDFVMAYAATPEITEGYSAKVSMSFYHMLSKVMFTFYNQFDNTNTVLRITSLSIQAVPSTGNLAVTSAFPEGSVWSDVSGTNDLTIDIPTPDTYDESPYIYSVLGNAATTTSLPTSYQPTDYKYLIPVDGADYNVVFTVNMYQKSTEGLVLEDSFTHTVAMPKVDLQLGYAYNFIVKLDAANINPSGALNPIQFTVESVDDWNVATDTQLEL